MNITRKLCSPNKNDTEEKDRQEIVDAIHPFLEETVDSIVRTHWRKLIALSHDDIVSAVWGTNGDHKLTTQQETIYREIAPSVKKVFGFLDRGNLSEAQKLAVHYLISGMMAYKMIFMTTVVKSRLGVQAPDEKDVPNTLLDMNVAGHA